MKRNYLLLFSRRSVFWQLRPINYSVRCYVFYPGRCDGNCSGRCLGVRNADIQGTGLLLLKGTAAQNVNMNGFTVNTSVEIDNTNHITLTGAARTAGLLTFTNGKIILGTNNLIMAPTATFAGAGTGKFVETNGTGQLRREICSKRKPGFTSLYRNPLYPA